MKSLLLALVIAISVSLWSYTKLQNHTGYGNAKTTIKGAGLVFIMAFIIVFTIGQFVLFH
jgi:hypothetical protein